MDKKKSKKEANALIREREKFYTNFSEEAPKAPQSERRNLKPVITSDFKELVVSESFIDKTLFIKDIIDNNEKVQSILRPFGFGRSTNISMLEYFFSVSHSNNRYLFKHYEIWGMKDKSDHSYIDEYQGQYPVIKLDFVNISVKNVDEMKKQFKYLIVKVIFDHQISKEEHERNQYLIKLANIEVEDPEFKNSLKELTEYLFKHYKKKVILLIDNPDMPLLAINKEDREKSYEFILDILKPALKGNDAFLFKAIILSTFITLKGNHPSVLNNVTYFDIFDDKYDRYFGFTNEELEKFSPSGSTLNLLNNFGNHKIGKNYLYPCTILSIFNDASYSWSRTYGDNPCFINQLKIIKEDNRVYKVMDEGLLKNSDISLNINRRYFFLNLINAESQNFFNFLIFSGYLTVKEYDIKSKKGFLLIPNEDVKQFFKDFIQTFGLTESQFEILKVSS